MKAPGALDEAAMNEMLTKTRYTPEEFLELPDNKRFELVNGKLVERPMSTMASLVAVKVIQKLSNYVDANPVGDVLESEASYQCFPDDPDKVRKPDISFIRNGRLPPEQLHKGHIRIAPDLAVEVLSPNDLAYEVDEKVREYLEAEVQLVWIIDPEARTVIIHRKNGTKEILVESQDLKGEDVIPKFHCRVQDLFPKLNVAESHAS